MWLDQHGPTWRTLRPPLPRLLPGCISCRKLENCVCLLWTWTTLWRSRSLTTCTAAESQSWTGESTACPNTARFVYWTAARKNYLLLLSFVSSLMLHISTLSFVTQRAWKPCWHHASPKFINPDLVTLLHSARCELCYTRRTLTVNVPTAAHGAARSSTWLLSLLTAHYLLLSFPRSCRSIMAHDTKWFIVQEY